MNASAVLLDSSLSSIPGELRILHEILEGDENIEYWMSDAGATPQSSTLSDMRSV